MRGDDRYARRFAELRSRGQGAFVPFAVLGDPDPETSLALLHAFAEGGADMLELGIPFSDPVADGPTIQAADLRALEAGATPALALDLVARFRKVRPDIPVGLLLYANLVHRPGLDRFYRRCARAGVDSVLVADLPLEESAPFNRAARSAGVQPVFLVTPNSDDARTRKIVRAGGAYLYVVARTGVTGRDQKLSDAAAPLLKRIRRHGSPPTLLGFGIGKPAHVRQAIAAGASGAISGSAVVEVVSRHAAAGQPLSARRRKALCEEVRRFVASMKRATRG